MVMSWYSTGIRCHLNHDCTGGDKVIALFDAAEHFHLLAVVHAKSDGILHVAVFIEAYIDEEVALFFGYSLNGSDYTIVLYRADEEHLGIRAWNYLAIVGELESYRNVTRSGCSDSTRDDRPSREGRKPCRCRWA